MDLVLQNTAIRILIRLHNLNLLTTSVRKIIPSSLSRNKLITDLTNHWRNHRKSKSQKIRESNCVFMPQSQIVTGIIKRRNLIVFQDEYMYIYIYVIKPAQSLLISLVYGWLIISILTRRCDCSSMFSNNVGEIVNGDRNANKPKQFAHVYRNRNKNKRKHGNTLVTRNVWAYPLWSEWVLSLDITHNDEFFGFFYLF